MTKKLSMFLKSLKSVMQTTKQHTLKNAGLFEPKFGSSMDKPKCWVKNVFSNFNPTVKFSN